METRQHQIVTQWDCEYTEYPGIRNGSDYAQELVHDNLEAIYYQGREVLALPLYFPFTSTDYVLGRELPPEE